jgi:hypothetical protein
MVTLKQIEEIIEEWNMTNHDDSDCAAQREGLACCLHEEHEKYSEFVRFLVCKLNGE